MNYKIDWLAFSLHFDDEKTNLDTEILQRLGYDFSEFEKIGGRNYYQNGATFYNFINVYWSEKDGRNSTTMSVVFTGQGCTDLAEKWGSDWFSIFQMLKNYEHGNIKITRIDIALDDFEEVVKMSAIEDKLERGHYLSAKQSYNIVKTKNANGEILGQTIYVGNARTDNGTKGNYYLRVYDKKAQYIAKKDLLPMSAQNGWIRYELSFSKQFAVSIADKILQNESIDRVFKTSLRRTLQLLTPKRGESDKQNWYKAKFWEDFLKIDDEISFGIAERDADFEDTMTWLKSAVFPTLALIDKIGQERGFDIYKVLANARKSGGFSKKQMRMYNNSKSLSDTKIQQILTNFLGGAGHG